VAEEHIMIAPCSNGIRSGNFTAFLAGTVTLSAKPPSTWCPSIAPDEQNVSRPARHCSQTLQVSR
jgi:hypothetical protein